jgi:shikimate dehydrogenase
LRLLYLLGHPVAHSLSPAMQNAVLRALGLGYEYRLMPVPPEGLVEKVAELRDGDVAGFNVTIPHKVVIIPLLDELDETASTVGAVNTVVNRDGRLKGYNTDCLASTRALRGAYGDLAGCRVVVLGAGGAARAVASGLASHAEWIKIIARDEEKAKALAKQVRGQADAEVRGGGLGEAAETIRSADILVNATPVGMSPDRDRSPVEAGALHPGLLVFDLVYNPERTSLLADAEAAGARTLGGLTMLVYQGAEAFRLWTGRVAPEALMMRAAREALGGAAA